MNASHSAYKTDVLLSFSLPGRAPGMWGGSSEEACPSAPRASS